MPTGTLIVAGAVAGVAAVDAEDAVEEVSLLITLVFARLRWLRRRRFPHDLQQTVANQSAVLAQSGPLEQ